MSRRGAVAVGGYCTVCRHDYRTTWLEHRFTKSHRAAEHKGEYKRSQRARINERRRHQRHLVSTLNELDRYGFAPEDQYFIQPHRRRRPLNGPKKTVHVHAYIRDYMYRPNGITEKERRHRRARARRGWRAA